MPEPAINPVLFQQLQAKIDEDAALRSTLKEIMQDWERKRLYLPFHFGLHCLPCVYRLNVFCLTERTTTSILTKIHSTPANHRKSLCDLPFACSVEGPFHSSHPDLSPCKVNTVIAEGNKSLEAQSESISQISKAIASHPYWKYNTVWSREVQQTVRDLAFPVAKIVNVRT